MRWIIDGGLLVLLIYLAYEDFKFRAISWKSLPLILIGFLAKGLLWIPWQLLLQYSLINTGLLVIQLAGIYIYILMRYGRKGVGIQQYIGSGDMLTLLLLGMLFEPLNFVIFLIASYSLILIVWIAGKKYLAPGNPHIPLAGGLAIITIFCILGASLTDGWPFYRIDWIPVNIETIHL